ncbi:MAG: NAD+ synthase [Alphaproteobacteria bacterium]|nr:NAD+ synthase [Alphaproteobacteria bacterium]
MSQQMLAALAQLNPIMGNIAGNTAKLIATWREAQRRGAKLVITSEMYMTGYSPEDFILKPRIHKVIRECIEALARDTAAGPAILLGTPWVENGAIYNAALLIEGGKIIDRTFKHDLPNYGPFDDKRIFTAGPMPHPIEWRGLKLGVMLCEDMWTPSIAAELKRQGAEILITLNGSPFQVGRQQKRYEVALERVQQTELPLIYVNQYGGQDELVYEGSSFVLSPRGELRVQARAWSEDIVFVPFSSLNGALCPDPLPLSEVPVAQESVYQALMTGLRDYVTKNKFTSVLLGLSGGIDSALVATLAVDTLGVDKVMTVMMPSAYTSKESRDDAEQMARNLGCRLDTIPIDDLMTGFDTALADQFMGCPSDTSEENIQARIRGMLLMAISNKSGAMVLATGNKSELAVGYATLYGDMCGGYAPLKDVYKTEVYKLAHWRNAHKPLLAMGPDGSPIPERILTKPPSAELKPNQTDQDTLPPYETLDDILKCLIEKDLGVAETTMMGHDASIIRKVYAMVDRAEYKRRQAPPGPKVTRKHLTKDRRYPMTNRYSDKWRTQQSD